MPDLRSAFDELHRRLSVHEAAFLASHELTDANTAAGRGDAGKAPDGCVLFGAPTDLTRRERERYAAAGLLRG